MYLIQCQVKLTIRGPFITKSSSPGAFGLDAVAARDYSGRPYIPGTHVAGKLKEALQEIEKSLPADSAGVTFKPQIDTWFGMSGDGLRKNLHIGDFELEAEDYSPGTLCRIAIDEDRGSVCKGAYQVIESLFSPGREYVFKGNIAFSAADKDEEENLIRHLEIGFKWIPQLGANRTIGFGRLTKAEIEKDNIGRWPIAHVSLLPLFKTPKFDYTLQPLIPFCVDNRRPNRFLFASDEIIPGGVIKGAIASMWGALMGKPSATPVDEKLDGTRRELGKNFEKIRFTHAFPGKDCLVRPATAPLSLVKVKDEGGKERLYDVSRYKEPVLIHGNSPAFAVDWKRVSDVRERFGWANTRRELRIRTAISYEHRRSAEEQLFAYESIVPEGLLWYGQVDLSKVADPIEREKTEDQLRSLLAEGLTAFGKTKAPAAMKFLTPGTVKSACPSFSGDRGGVWVITLQTSAILCNPVGLNETSGRKELWKAYKDAWSDLSEGSMDLSHYFARQSLAGGEYVYKHFQPGKQYRPFLLTEAGGVFVLRALDIDKARQNISQWMESGLPLPHWAREAYQRDGKPGDHWRNCPYIPENGYGEIAVNLNVHQTLAPQVESVQDFMAGGAK